MLKLHPIICTTMVWVLRFLAAAALAAMVVGYKQIRRYIVFLALQRRTGCEQLPTYPHVDFLFGYDLYRRRKQAREEGRNMALYIANMERLGKTWQENSLGQRVINVADPINYQYVHSTAPEDFPRLINRPSSNVLLGSGIYLSEGER